jgi:geranylgeranylglycerol-phosphate geranylgeranyltransferase
MYSGVTYRDKIQALISISRIMSSQMIGLAMIVGVLTAGGLNTDLPFEFYIFIYIGGTAVAIHAMVYNDILDLEIDKINAPKRPLPSGKLSIREANLYHIAIAFIGILFFYFADMTTSKYNFTWWYGLFHILLADLYSLRLKKTGIPGNFVVAWMSYAAFLYGDIIVNEGFTAVTQGLGIAAFLLSFSREIVKSLMDIEGDDKFHVKTVAVVFGEENASNFTLIIHIILLLIFIFPIFWFSNILGRLGSILVIGFMIQLMRTNSFDYNSSNAKSVKTKLLLPPLLITPFVILDTII